MKRVSMILAVVFAVTMMTTAAFAAESTYAEKVSKVTSTPVCGTVAKGSLIELETATQGATIRFTTDGTAPTEKSETYKTPIMITESTTFKAVAYKDGMASSDMATLKYTIAATFSLNINNVEIKDNRMVAVSVYNPSFETVSGMVIVGLYDGDVLIESVVIDKTFASNQTTAFKARFATKDVSDRYDIRVSIYKDINQGQLIASL